MVTVLVVDSNPQTRQALAHTLVAAGYQVIEAETGAHALERIKNDLPEIVILDVMLQDMTAFQVCQQLLEMPQSDLVHLMMLSPVPGIDHKIRGLDKGADEYLTKPVNPKVLIARIQQGSATISQKRTMVLNLQTRLYNRTFFQIYFAQEVSRAQRYQNQLSIIMAAIDRFAEFQNMADQSGLEPLLTNAADIVRRSCRRSDLAVHWDVGQFVILTHETDLMGAMLFAERVRQSVESFHFPNLPQITMSFGVATLKTNREDLLARATQSLVKAQASDGNKVVTATKDERR